VPLWSVAPGHAPDDLSPEALTWDDRAVYLAGRDGLQARSVSTGHLLWRRPLPAMSAGWAVRSLGPALLAHPRPVVPLPALPFGGPPLAWLTTVARPGERGADFPLLLIDPRDGRPVQRVTAAGGRGPGQVVVAGGRVLVSAGGIIEGFAPPADE
jgi:hypothetical protein